MSKAERAATFDLAVETYAALLFSDDPSKVKSGCDRLRDLFTNHGTWGALWFARVAQELAVYHGGVVPHRILRVTLWQSACHPTNLGFQHFVSSTGALGVLTASKAVVESCLKVQVGSDERVNAMQLYQRLMRQADPVLLSKVENAGVAADEGFQLIWVGSLECLANCARASKVFRDAMSEGTGQRNVFKHFEEFLSAGCLSKRMSAEMALKVRLHLAGLAVSLAFSADSQLWAIDRGLLKLVAAIYEASPLREHRKLSNQNESPAFRCNKVLLRLLSAESAAEKMRAHNALEDFRPHKRKIDSAEAETEPWAYYEKFLQGETSRLLRRERSAEEWKDQEEKLSGEFWIPVVCSWKVCGAGREPAVGREFGKCARCHVARYCSKEHQKLHWGTHKVDCKGFGKREGAASCTHP